MRIRFALLRRCLLATVCTVSLGCTISPFSLPQVRLAGPRDRDATVVVTDAPTGIAAEKSLPSHSQSAEDCLKAAREMEAHDQDLAAIEQYERARTFEPQLPGVARHLAVLYQRTGDVDRAAVEFTAALKEEPQHADLWNDAASFRFQRGEYAKAEDAAREAIHLSPDHKRAWVNLGLSLAEQKQHDEAFAAFERAAGSAAAHNNLGIILARQGRLDDARRELAEARRLDPTLRPPPAVAEFLAKAEADDKSTTSEKTGSNTKPRRTAAW